MALFVGTGGCWSVLWILHCRKGVIKTESHSAVSQPLTDCLQYFLHHERNINFHEQSKLEILQEIGRLYDWNSPCSVVKPGSFSFNLIRNAHCIILTIRRNNLLHEWVFMVQAYLRVYIHNETAGYETLQRRVHLLLEAFRWFEGDRSAA